MSASSVTIKGQVTIPQAIREQLRIKPGDRVRFVAQEGRVYLVRQENEVAAAFGMLKAKRSASREDIRKEIERGWSRRARR